jgi:hypothetical protein
MTGSTRQMRVCACVRVCVYACMRVCMRARRRTLLWWWLCKRCLSYLYNQYQHSGIFWPETYVGKVGFTLHKAGLMHLIATIYVQTAHERCHEHIQCVGLPVRFVHSLLVAVTRQQYRHCSLMNTTPWGRMWEQSYNCRHYRGSQQGILVWVQISSPKREWRRRQNMGGEGEF